MNKISFHIPDIEQDEIQAVVASMTSLNIVGDGPEGHRVQDLMNDLFNVRHAMLTTSCTHAMELALMALDIGPGDEVILPSFTFSSTANAIVLHGAKPIFAEIEPKTLMIDPADIEHRITSRTKAIMPVHYAGIGCPMDEIMVIAKHHNLYVIEDAAQGVGGKYRNRYLGTIGDIGCFSFHGTKIITCGEGGALLTNNDSIAHHVEILREKGTNRSAFLRGEVDKYTWVDRGSSYVLSDILASILSVQLKKMSSLIEARKHIHNCYMEGFIDLEKRGYVTLPTIPDYAESNYHIFYLLLENNNKRNNLLDTLKAEGIGASFHYIPLHSSPFGIKLGYRADDYPITKRIGQQLIRLPIYPRLCEEDIHRVIRVIHSFFSKSQ